MKTHMLTALVVSLLLAGSLQAAEAPRSAGSERFYGTIVSIDSAGRSLTVLNKKRKLETQFKWDQSTAFVSDKKTIQPADLAVGQYLVISYVTDGNRNTAKRVSVRPVPFKKKASIN